MYLEPSLHANYDTGKVSISVFLRTLPYISFSDTCSRIKYLLFKCVPSLRVEISQLLDRCNASSAYSFFSAPEIDLVMYLCHYGNIHFFFYSEDYKKEVGRQATVVGMIEVEKCYEVFSESGAIEGRQMKWMGGRS